MAALIGSVKLLWRTHIANKQSYTLQSLCLIEPNVFCYQYLYVALFVMLAHAVWYTLLPGFHSESLS